MSWSFGKGVCYATWAFPSIHESNNHPARCMKLPLLFALTASALCAGCNSLDSPLTSLNPFRSGHDGRVYNIQTGEYEWPKDATPRPVKSARRAGRTPSTPSPNPDDGRPYDPQKSEFREPQPGR